MNRAETIYEALIISHLNLIFDSTLAFFALALVLLIILSFTQIIMEKVHVKMDAKKSIFVEQVSQYLFFGENRLEVTSKYDYYALSDAIIELNNFVCKADRKQIYALIEMYDLDYFLLKRYKKSFLKISRRFFYSKLLFVASPRLKGFYVEQLDQQKHFEMMLYALYSFSDLAEDRDDLIQIFTTLKTNYDRGISLKFCEFVFTQAFESVPIEEIRSFFLFLEKQTQETMLLKSIISAVGDMKYTALQNDIRKLYEGHKDDKLVFVTYLRALYKMEVHDCALIKAYYLEEAAIIRINLSKYALFLCPATFEQLYIYMFDKNYYVRRNFFESLKEIKISREQIEAIVKARSPHKAKDRFFLDALNAFYPKAVT